MGDIVLRNRRGKEIVDWRDWPRPKRHGQWRTARSAMELARAWFTSPEPMCPPEVRALLDSSPLTSGLRFTEGFPEYVTKLPQPGEGRNHDLILRGHRGSHSVVVSIEAKADEPFGEFIGDYCSRMLRSKRPTGAPKRIESLLSLLFGPEADPRRPPWKTLRYQLLTGIAGTAIQASRDGADIGVFVIHEFRTADTDARKLASNARDLGRFLQALIPISSSEIAPSALLGPVRLTKGGPLKNDVAVLVGKAIYDWEKK